MLVVNKLSITSTLNDILLIINYLLVKKYSKFLNLNLFLQRIFFQKHLKMAKTVQPSTSINYLQYHLFSESWKEKEAVPESHPVSARCPSGKLAYLQGLYLENNVIHRLLVHELFICNFISRTGKKFKKLNMLYKHKC